MENGEWRFLSQEEKQVAIKCITGGYTEGEELEAIDWLIKHIETNKDKIDCYNKLKQRSRDPFKDFNCVKKQDGLFIKNPIEFYTKKIKSDTEYQNRETPFKRKLVNEIGSLIDVISLVNEKFSLLNNEKLLERKTQLNNKSIDQLIKEKNCFSKINSILQNGVSNLSRQNNTQIGLKQSLYTKSNFLEFFCSKLKKTRSCTF